MPDSDAGSQIQEIRVHTYELTYVHGTYVMSKGREIAALTSIVVSVETASGVVGWAEVCPLGPNYLPGFAGGVLAAMQELAPALVGVDAMNLSAVADAMHGALRGHDYAKSVLDIACWDAFGKTVGLPVATLLGGVVNESFPLYLAVPLGAPEVMAEFVKEAKQEGIQRFQLKIGSSPTDDSERVAAVVDATDDDDVIIADANGGWRLQDAIVAARLLEQLPRVRLEQPCPTIEECIALRARTSIPIVLDEVITDVHALLRCFDAGAMDAINLKLSRVGGLTAARLIRDLAESLGLRVTIEDTWGGDLTTAAVSQLAASTSVPALYSASFMNDWTAEHIAGYAPRSAHGRGSAPEGPGLGVEVDPSALGNPIQRYC
ncbi:MAG: Mandelate racemase/muconate lactonizing protein [Acidimicrobiaceae bacterium]|jgi:L-alanine-DL-glutamate epimerase-like enolase superfamily enzyme|nr:Mandelate racemase/muconate lactonizing protein [Acidimicrobiaceae bacterium]